MSKVSARRPFFKNAALGARSPFFCDNHFSALDIVLTTINFQARDLDLQAMGGGGDGTEKKLWTHTYHQTIYESDPSKGLEIMRCSN